MIYVRCDGNRLSFFHRCSLMPGADKEADAALLLSMSQLQPIEGAVRRAMESLRKMQERVNREALAKRAPPK